MSLTSEPCEACGGSGQVIVGEHYVTSDMASDAGEPSMAGSFYGYEHGPCDECGGAGLIDWKERAKTAKADLLSAREELQALKDGTLSVAETQSLLGSDRPVSIGKVPTDPIGMRTIAAVVSERLAVIALERGLEQMDTTEREFPRRCYVDLQTPAEHAISAAIAAVEAAGCDVRLTDAVVLLGAAKESVADFVDGIAGMQRDLRAQDQTARFKAEADLKLAREELATAGLLIAQWKESYEGTHHAQEQREWQAERERTAAAAETLREELATLKAEVALVREAARDASLSDGAVRCIANGTEPPTADDIAWATRCLEKHGLIPVEIQTVEDE